jgi:hypothetical protein
MMATPEKVEQKVNQSVQNADYNKFYSRKVKMNVVEKQVREYHLDQEEIDHKRKKSKSARK